MPSRSTTLTLLDLESRLVPSSYSVADKPTGVVAAQVGDPTPLPVQVGTNDQGQAIFTITVQPKVCNCAACQAARAATAHEATAVPQPAPTPVVAPAREPAPPTVTVASNPNPTPAAIPSPAKPATVTLPVSVAPPFAVPPATPSITTPTQPDVQRWADDSTRLAKFASLDVSTTGEPDRITVPQGGDTLGHLPDDRRGVWADPFASGLMALTPDTI
jgi:hypothetical protein